MQNIFTETLMQELFFLGTKIRLHFPKEDHSIFSKLNRQLMKSVLELPLNVRKTRGKDIRFNINIMLQRIR